MAIVALVFASCSNGTIVAPENFTEEAPVIVESIDVPAVTEIIEDVASLDNLEDGLIRETCENDCGNGICESIVCQGTNCSCYETSEICPSDCD